MPAGALLLSAPVRSVHWMLGVMSGEDVTEFDRPRELSPAAVTQLLCLVRFICKQLGWSW
jgi:hypothetical protein